MADNLPTPESRKELYLAKAAGEDVTVPTPASREELFLNAIAEGGGGSSINVVQTTGQSEADVMSQKAVTDALANGGFKLLTADDYNYDYGHTGSNNIVGLWKLPEGNYYTTDTTVQITPTTGTVGAVSPNYWKNYSGVFFVGPSDAFGKHIIMINNRGNGQNGQLRTIVKVNVDPSSGSSWGYQSALDNQNVKNVLDSYETEQPLSANQGRILNGKIEGRIITGTGAPTTSTAGTVGLLYEDTTNGKLYICTDASNPYVWTEIGAGGGAKILTTADFDYPAGDSPFAVNLENLDGGLYTIGESGVTVYFGGSTFNTTNGDNIFLIKVNSYVMWLSFYGFEVYVRTAYEGHGTMNLNTQVMTQYNMPLFIQKNYGEPTATTFGQTGGLRTGVDSTTHEPALYICGGSDPNNPGQYIWRKATLTSI